MNDQGRDFRKLLDTTGETIDALYAGRRTHMRIDGLSDHYLHTLRFDLNLLSQAIEHELAKRKEEEIE